MARKKPINYGTFTCDVCGKAGVKHSGCQVRHGGRCKRLAKRRDESSRQRFRGKDGVHAEAAPIRKDLWDSRLHELSRRIAEGIEDPELTTDDLRRQRLHAGARVRLMEMAQRAGMVG